MAECYSIFASSLSNLTSIHQFFDSTTIQLRYQSFGICLDDEHQVGSPIPGIWNITILNEQWRYSNHPKNRTPENQTVLCPVFEWYQHLKIGHMIFMRFCAFQANIGKTDQSVQFAIWQLDKNVQFWTPFESRIIQYSDCYFTRIVSYSDCYFTRIVSYSACYLTWQLQ